MHSTQSSKALCSVAEFPSSSTIERGATSVCVSSSNRSSTCSSIGEQVRVSSGDVEDPSKSQSCFFFSALVSVWWLGVFDRGSCWTSEVEEELSS